jgi:hypothetical protein
MMTKKAFDKIAEGLKEALAWVRGDVALIVHTVEDGEHTSRSMTFAEYTANAKRPAPRHEWRGALSELKRGRIPPAHMTPRSGGGEARRRGIQGKK